MDNGTKLSQEQINNIVTKAKELSSQGKVPDGDFLKEQLGSAQSEQLRSLLNDPERLREIMNSPMAKRLLSMLGNRAKE